MNRALMCLLTILITACAAAPLGRSELLDFIQDGKTTREETYLNLGEPSRLFEEGRIMSFHLGQDKGGYFLLENAKGFVAVKYNLMMAFNEEGILRRHSLVQVKAP